MSYYLDQLTRIGVDYHAPDWIDRLTEEQKATIERNKVEWGKTEELLNLLESYDGKYWSDRRDCYRVYFQLDRILYLASLLDPTFEGPKEAVCRITRPKDSIFVCLTDKRWYIGREGMVPRSNNGIFDNRAFDICSKWAMDGFPPLDNFVSLPRKINRYAVKLDPDQVLEIRARYNSGESKESLAKEYGISVSGLVQAATGKTWADVRD